MKPARLLLLPLGATLVLAADPETDARQTAYRTSIAQEAVRNDAEKVKAALAAIIAEAQLNGLGDQDAEALRPILEKLGVLTRQEMQAVIDSLKSAGLATDPSRRRQQISSAYQGQQAIATRLYSLAGNLQVRQAREALPRDLRDLLGRQLANLRLTLDLQQKTGGADDAARQTVAETQKSLADDIDTFAKNLGELAASLPPEEAAPFKAALAVTDAARLTDAARQAALSAQAGDLAAAAGQEIRVRNALIAASKAMLAKQTHAEQLVQISETLERIIAEQQDVNTATRAPGSVAALLAGRETTLADRTGILKNINATLAPAAITALEDGRQSMQRAADSLADNRTGADTLGFQDAALTALHRARQELAAQIQAGEKALAAAAARLAEARAHVARAEQNLNKKDPSAASTELAAARQAAAAAAGDPAIPPAAQNPLAGAQANLDAAQAAAARSNLDNAGLETTQAGQKLADAQAAIAQARSALAQQAQAVQAAANADAAQSLQAAQAAASQAQQTLQNPAATSAQQSSAAQAAAQAAQAAAAAQASANAAQQAASAPSDAATSRQAAAQQAMQTAAQSLQQAASAAQNGQNNAAQQAASAARQALAQAASAQTAAAQMSTAAGTLLGSNQVAADSTTPPTGGGAGPGGPRGDGSNSLLGGGGPEGTGQVLTGLRPRDRDAIAQADAEKTPAEFTPLVRQYLKNLADGVTP